jgi:TusA-related sulfurtransferase
MSLFVDARGLTCPQPVVLTRKATVDSAEVGTVANRSQIL